MAATSTVEPIGLGIARAFLARGERGSILVDTGTAGNARRILGALDNCGITPTGLSLIVITHAHNDHTGSLYEVKSATGARALAHRLEAEHVRAGTLPPPRSGSRSARLVVGLPRGPRLGGVDVDILVDEAFDLGQFGIPGRVMHTPGHTAGSLSVVLDSGEAIVGDLVLPRFMFFGPPAIAFWASSRQQSLHSIGRVLAHRPTAIHTSHGGPYRPSALQRLLDSGTTLGAS